MRASTSSNSSLAEPDLYSAGNKPRLNELLREKADVDQQIAALESDWLEACEQLEAQQQ